MVDACNRDSTLLVGNGVGRDLLLEPMSRANGHGPVFGAATPTLGRGGWSIDQAYTFRGGQGDDPHSQQMFKTMVSFGITETLQISGSIPLAMGDGLGPSRMMSAMSSEREFEGLLAYRFQRRRLASAVARNRRCMLAAPCRWKTHEQAFPLAPSVVVQAATGYASRAHYAWVGGGVQHFFEHDGGQQGASRFLTSVYGYRPPPFRVEPGKPDLRFFVEMTAEDRTRRRARRYRHERRRPHGVRRSNVLLVYKAIAVEGGVLFPVYQGTSTAARANARRRQLRVFLLAKMRSCT